jgi:hypothetical protein
MDRIFNFVRSDLFLSITGGFALGVVGLAVVKPANANIGDAASAQSISVGAPVYEETTPVQ